MKEIGLKGIGMIPAQVSGGSFGIQPWDFDPLLVSMTPGMAKRATSVFAASPIVQGKRDGTGNCDYLQLSLPTTILPSFSNIKDENQGSITFRITPEWNGNDGIVHNIVTAKSTYGLGVVKHSDNTLKIWRTSWGGVCSIDVSAWVAGTTYNICVRWDTKNTLDGTNYFCISINDVHTFSGVTLYVSGSVNDYTLIGHEFPATLPANAIIEGLTVYRRVLYDGTYGVNVGNGDEVALIAAGVDPTTVTGSWDVCFCLPTNATAGALVTGTGEAWSHPHSSNLLTRGFLNDRYYGGSQWGVKFNGTTTNINCGSGATLDDLCAGGAIMQVEGWFKSDILAAQTIIGKGLAGTGWLLQILAAGSLQFYIALATTSVTANPGLAIISDGKWHHVVGHYNDTTKSGQVAIDGVWGSAVVGAGAYISDAGQDLVMGRRSSGATTNYLNGSLGWINIHNDAHYTPGTNFLPPRTPPAPDVEEWLLNEGTGVVATAQVTTPGNDGTITAGTWEPQWYDEGTPVRLRSVAGSATYRAVITSAAEISDLADGAMTVEGWFRLLPSSILIYKGTYASTGWRLVTNAAGNILAYVYCATTAALSYNVTNYCDNYWHYLKMTFDDAGDRKIRIYVDNAEIAYTVQTAGVGAIISDAGVDALIGSSAGGLLGAHSWIRLSNVVRGAGMIPRSNPPDPADANTMFQINADEGAGAVLTDLSGEGNNGAMAGTYSWQNSPAMESDSPGARNYAWGYVFGNDAADEGFKQTWSGLTAGKDYVIRALAYSEDGVGQPEMIVYDETNAAILKTMTGTVTSTEKTPDLLMCSFELPTNARGAAADCTSISVKIINTVATGVVGFQQVELLANLLDNPSLDTGAVADPWIPDGYTNIDLDAGDTEIETVVTHSGASSMQHNTTSSNEKFTYPTTIALAKYMGFGYWTYNDASAGFIQGANDGASLKAQYSTTVYSLVSSHLASWKHNLLVYRITGVNPFHALYSDAGAVGARYLDDLYAILLDDVSLTVTPASAVNSVESGGIRVDGWDIAPQPIPAGRLFPTIGWVRIRCIPRHAGADALKFGSATPYIAEWYGDVNNYFYIYWSAANTMTLAFKSAGGALQTGNWATAGAILAGGNYLLEVRYDLNNMYLYVNSVLRITVTSPIAFTTIPVFCYPATANALVAGQHEDAVFLAP